MNSGSFPAIGREVGKGLHELSKNLLSWPLLSPGTTVPGAAYALVRSGIIRPADSSRTDNAPDATGSNLHEGKPARPALGPDARAARRLEAGRDGIAELFARLTEAHRVR